MPFIIIAMNIRSRIHFCLSAEAILLTGDEINQKGPSLVISDKAITELKKALPNTAVIKVASLVQSYWKFHQVLSRSFYNTCRYNNGNMR